MNQWENTLVMFLSDNGASAEIMIRDDGHDPQAAAGSADTHLCLGPGWSTVANTPFRKHKTWVHEGGIATPLIVHWPAVIKTSGLRTTVGHVIDLVPTILDVAGGSIENDPERSPAFPGRSLMGVLRADSPVEREYLWWSHEGHRAIRMDNWKLVKTRQSAWELFDLSVDRGESKDLSKQYPDRVERMTRLWKSQEERFVDDLQRFEKATAQQAD